MNVLRHLDTTHFSAILGTGGMDEISISDAATHPHTSADNSSSSSSRCLIIDHHVVVMSVHDVIEKRNYTVLPRSFSDSTVYYVTDI